MRLIHNTVSALNKNGCHGQSGKKIKGLLGFGV